VLAAMISTALPVYGQGRETKFNIRFTFNVGNRVLPPGTYGVERVFEEWLMVRNLGTWDSTLVSSSAVSPVPGDVPWRLVFHCYGKKCFLYQAWVGAVGAGRELIRSSQEIEVAQQAQPQMQYVEASLR